MTNRPAHASITTPKKRAHFVPITTSPRSLIPGNSPRDAGTHPELLPSLDLDAVLVAHRRVRKHADEVHQVPHDLRVLLLVLAEAEHAGAVDAGVDPVV